MSRLNYLPIVDEQIHFTINGYSKHKSPRSFDYQTTECVFSFVCSSNYNYLYSVSTNGHIRSFRAILSLER